VPAIDGVGTGAIAGSNPTPVSLTVMTMSVGILVTERLIRPPRGVYFAAFIKRLEIACDKRSGSALISIGSSG
jgi:hypothetical protein